MTAYRPPSHLLRFGVALFLSVLLAGCIVVQRFGAYWDKGFDDPCIQQIVETTMLEGNPQGIPVKTLARSIKIGPYRFVMLRDKPGSESGTLYRYSVSKNQYTAYRLNEKMRGTFEKDFPHNSLVTLTEETATIAELDEPTAKLLEAIAANDAYWVPADTRPYNPGARRDCAEKS